MFELGWLSWIIVGLIVGLIGKALTKNSFPLWLTIVLGIVGAALGGLIAGLLNLGPADGGGWGFWNPMMWIFAIIGAVIVMSVVAMLSRGRGTGTRV